MATQIDLGAVVPIGKGDWNPSTTYERANIVRHNSVAWICKVSTSLGVEPTEDSSDWYLLVKDTSSVTSINGMRGDVTIGLPLGHIYLWPFSIPPDGSIQLNGSTYSRELYSDLWNLIQTKGWYKSEAEWQSIASANNGYCPWYSDGDGSTTFRVPKFAPYQKLAIASGDAGNYYDAGLPNIKGELAGISRMDNMKGQGVLQWKLLDYDTATAPINRSAARDIVFDASIASSIYGKSSTVQPESNDWIVCVAAFGKATNVGSVDVANVMSAISQVQSEINIILPVGSVIASATNATPDGYLICNGAAISRTTYAALFAAIGTIYGIGDGSTTFNLPNLVDRFIQGSGTSGTVLDAGLPNITGHLTMCAWSLTDDSLGNGCDGAFELLKDVNNGEHYEAVWSQEPGLRRAKAQLNASKSNPIYGKSNTVQPPALTMRYYIKY